MERPVAESLLNAFGPADPGRVSLHWTPFRITFGTLWGEIFRELNAVVIRDLGAICGRP